MRELEGAVRAVVEERAVDEDAVDDAELGEAGGAEGHADGAAALEHVRVLDEAPRALVGDGVHAGDLAVGVDAALVGGIGVDAAVPVEVVLGDAQDHGRLAGRVLGAVQLEGGELDGEDVEALRVQRRLDDGQPDVAAGDGAQPRRTQDRLEHRDHGGLAVGAGDAEPGGAVGRLHAARQLDLAPHGDPGVGGGEEQGLVEAPARGGDDEVEGRAVGGLGQGARVLGTEAHVDPEDLEDPGPLEVPLAAGAVDDGHAGAALHGLVGHRVAGDAEARHEDAQARDVEPGPGQLVDAHRGRGGHDTTRGIASM